MAKRTGYTINPHRGREWNAHVDQALFAAARVITTDVILRFKARKGGYTTGAFAHPGDAGVSDTITQSDAHDHNGKRRIVIGTNKRTDDGFSYPLAWEFGHLNIYTVNYERVETFRPAMDDNRDRALAAFKRVLERLRKGRVIELVGDEQ